MLNDKWVKLFITTTTQTLVIARPANDVEGGLQVEATVMLDGAVHSKLLYAGKDSDKQQSVFDSFTREDAVDFVADEAKAEGTKE